MREARGSWRGTVAPSDEARAVDHTVPSISIDQLFKMADMPNNTAMSKTCESARRIYSPPIRHKERGV